MSKGDLEYLMLYQGLDAGEVIAIAAVGVAVASFIATILTYLSQKKHNQLSVRPLADVLLSDFRNRVAVSVINKGVGPLIIKDLIFKSEEKILEPQKEGLVSLLPEMRQGYAWKAFTRLGQGSIISPGEKRVLVELQWDPDDYQADEHAMRVRNVLSNISINIDYTDLYKSKVFKMVKDLDWFSRY